MTEARYRPLGFFMLRAPARPLLVDGRLDRPRTEGGLARTATEALADAHLSVALRVASPSLRATLEKATGGRERDAGRTERAARSLRRYSIRMASRPTPFGLFAGVATGTFGSTTSLRLGPEAIDRVRVQPDLGWVTAVLSRLASGDRARLLGTTSNPSVYRAGDRLIVASSDVLGTSSANLVDLRLTPAVEIALAMAGRRASLVEIARELSEAYPDVPEAVIDGMLDELVGNSVVFPLLQPSLEPGQGTAYIAEMLRGVEGYAEEVDALETLDRLLGDVVDAASLARVVDELDTVQRELAPDFDGHRLAVDSALALDAAVLSAKVGETAAEAASLLVTISGAPARLPHLVSFENALIERAGLLSEVPVLDILSPELGLEAPETYAYPPRTFDLPRSPAPGTSARDVVLLHRLLEHLRSGREHLELTDADVADLAAAGDRGVAARPLVEIYASVSARSAAAIDAGDFVLSVAPGGLCDAGRTFGRFDGLFDAQSSRHLADTARRERELHPSARTVELRYLAQTARYSNVSRSPVLHDLEMAVNCAPALGPDHQVHLEDVLVGASGQGLYLRWRKTGERLRFVQNNMLSTIAAPNVVRFLLEVSRDGEAPPVAFSWGICGDAPFLPRVVRGNLVLSPARWLLSLELLGAPESAEEFAAALAAWREEQKVPRHVYLTVVDNRLLLDLTSEPDLDLLRDDLSAAARDATPVSLEEMLPTPEDHWLEDTDGRRYAAELVIPLESVEPRGEGAAAAHGALAVTPVTCVETHQPGGRWVSVELYGSEQQLERVVAEELDLLVTELRSRAAFDHWFFIRYNDPAHHLRVRFRLAEEGADRAREDVLGWARAVVDRGLLRSVSLVPYSPEARRYGGAEAFDAVLPVFEACAESAVQLAGARRRGEVDLPTDVLGAWLLHETFHAAGGGADPGHRSVEAATDDPVRARFRTVRRQLASLIAPSDLDSDADADRARKILGPSMEAMAVAVQRYAVEMQRLQAAGSLVGSPPEILRSVAHMRINRALLSGGEEESQSYLLLGLITTALRRRSAALAR